MPTSSICDVEPFRYQATPQIGDSNASTGQINDQFLEDYLNRLREAICADIESIIDECCNGGGGGGAETFLELTDTPAAYTGDGGKVVSVKAAEDGLEFTTPASSPDSDGLVLNYSTSEQATNRTWVDGKTIYQKTINFGALPAAGQKTVAHGISTIDFVIEAQAYTKNPSVSAYLYLPFASPTASNNIQLNVNATSVLITVGINRSAFTSTYVTLFYTKV